MKYALIMALLELSTSMATAAATKTIQATGHYFAGSSYGMYLGRMEMDLVSAAKSFCASQGETLDEIKDVKVIMNATFNEFENSRLSQATTFGKSKTIGMAVCKL